MTAWTLTLILVALLTLVAGQLLLKWALNEGDDDRESADHPRMSGTRRTLIFVGGIVAMTVSFFVNLGLLQKNDLSLVFPFQGLSVIIVTAGASFFLKERLTLPLVLGALLITVGVMLVAGS